MKTRKLIALLLVVFQFSFAYADDDAADSSDFNYAGTWHRIGLGAQATTGSTLGAQASLRLFRSWTFSIKGFGGGGGTNGTERTNKTNPDIPHDYDYQVSARPLWHASVTKDFWLASSNRFTWFAGGGAGEIQYDARYDFYNISGFTRNEAGTMRSSETRTVFSAVGGFRYVELKTGFFPFPLMASAQLEVPLLGRPDSSSVLSPEGKKVEESYDDDRANVSLFVGVLF